MLRARALIYSILISLIIAIISGALVSLSYSQRMLQWRAIEQERLYQNAHAAIQLAMSLEQPLTRTELSLYEGANDQVYLTKQYWGLFDLVLVESYIKDRTYLDSTTKVALLGTPLAKKWQHTLYLADQNYPLVLAGDAMIKGTAYLPDEGVKGGYIAGQPYTGKKKIYGTTKKSERQLPKIQVAKLASLENAFELAENAVVQDSLVQSFRKAPLIIRQKIISLNNQILKGNVILIADSLIQFGNNCQVENILAFAPVIEFGSGFQGSLQAFARQLLWVGEACNFYYPSVLGLVQQQNVKREDQKGELGIQIGDKTTVQGLIFAQKTSTDYVPKVQIAQNALIQGQIYCNADLDIRGQVEGNTMVWRSFVKTRSGYYQNYIMNARLDYSALSENFLLPSFLETKPLPKQNISLWLD